MVPSRTPESTRVNQVYSPLPSPPPSPPPEGAPPFPCSADCPHVLALTGAGYLFLSTRPKPRCEFWIADCRPSPPRNARPHVCLHIHHRRHYSRRSPHFADLYDASNPDARSWWWDLVQSGYFDYGIEIFWLDAAEPEQMGGYKGFDIILFFSFLFFLLMRLLARTQRL